MHAKYACFVLCAPSMYKMSKMNLQKNIILSEFSGKFFYYLFEQSQQHTKYFIWGLVIRRGHLAVDLYRRAVVVISIVLLLLYLSRISSRIQVII